MLLPAETKGSLRLTEADHSGSALPHSWKSGPVRSHHKQIETAETRGISDMIDPLLSLLCCFAPASGFRLALFYLAEVFPDCVDMQQG